MQHLVQTRLVEGGKGGKKGGRKEQRERAGGRREGRGREDGEETAKAGLAHTPCLLQDLCSDVSVSPGSGISGT